jgi:hypothetical protein
LRGLPGGFARSTLTLLLAALAIGSGLGAAVQSPAAARIATLSPVAALPAHIAGSFQELTACQQAPGGEYFIFDRRAHSVYVAPAGLETARKLIEIGAEPGRVLDPSAFDLAPDGTFAVTDAPGGSPRIQIFLASGSTLRGFRLPGRPVPRITLRTLVLSGLAAIEYTGRAIYISQPENGAVISEYNIDGQPQRSFGELRRTGHENDTDVHLALNSGLVIANPAGGFYFVFLSGVPQFRKYGNDGRLQFERHIEDPELDRFVQTLPTTWKRQKTEEGEIPLVLPSVLAAAADKQGDLWISTAAGVTVIYDSSGEKRRVVQFRGAGMISPTGMSFTSEGRLLVTPGCYAFPGN